MGERHVDHLFSLAYDGALDDAQRRRYDEHLAGCPRCTAAAAEFAAAVDAVRALPAARMPVRVVLPATPPVAERRSRALPAWLRLPPYPGAAWGAGAMAAVGIAAVVVAVHAHGGGSVGGGVTGARSAIANSVHAPQALSQHGAAAAPEIGASGAGATGSCTAPALVSGLDPSRLAAGQPAGFANRVAVTNPSRPGQELVLATTSGQYAPGSQVLIVAALTTSSGEHQAVVPCVTLNGPPSFAAGENAATPAPPTATAGGGEPQSGSFSQDSAVAPAYAYSLAPVGPPLAFAVPTAQSVAGSVPVQVITIPSSVARGTLLQLVAVVPAGLPGGSDRPALEAVLTVVVS